MAKQNVCALAAVNWGLFAWRVRLYGDIEDDY